MSEIKRKEHKIPEVSPPARPYKNTLVVIENPTTKTTIWLELDNTGYQVRKVTEPKSPSRH